MMFSSISKGMFRRPAKEASQVFAETRDFGPIRTDHLMTDANAAMAAAAQAGSMTAAALARESLNLAAPHLPKDDSNSAGQGSGRKDENRTQGNMGGSGHGPRILSIGGGKGGIGKSFFSANAAVCLTRLGYKVALVDLDFGAANLHTCLGVPSPKAGLFDFVSNRVENLEDVAVSGGVPGLTLYGGGQEFWQQIRPQSVQKIRLISKLQKLDADYVILDLGAGTHVNTLDFFIFSHAGIVVVVPEPTSIENAYVFLKSVLFRKLQSVVKAIRQEEATEKLLATLGDPKISVPPLVQLQQYAQEEPEVGQKILQLIQMTQVGIAMNQVRTKTDTDIGVSITQISKRYFGFSAEYIGAACYDDAAWKSVRNRRPLCVDFPDSQVAHSLERIAEVIARKFLPTSADGRVSQGIR